ncbi:MAG: UvrD-helicase domain-containing protein [Alphaproteobacteria bacterium]|nr:UvrD-helicase domain-containing protein [Alphaproteobacteria bacterium]MBO6627372.1 UvrD-helicase domain-containing protein [Alphaproteobacteria bacterium]MDF1626944.1 UvrD-helicase domain-containing protein [Parvibaculaceae bacterium]
MTDSDPFDLGSIPEEETARSSAPRPSLSAAAMGNMRPPYLNGLNTPQREAVEALDGPVLVLAGAGTGKTRVLTTRLAHMLATRKAWPSQVMAVTFTNKAAREMQHRIGALIGGAVEGMQWLGTFHSIGAKILRRHAELVGLRSDFTILDTDDQIRLLKQLIKADGIDEKRWPARQLASHIDGWKNRGLTPDKVPPGDAEQFGHGKGASLYAAYQERLKILNAADFGDLLLECLRLFQENPEVLADYQERFKYMLVDEYQDTNVAQYLWLRLLAQKNKNICCVGDDDQSIYGWRGAEVDNILRFEKDFPGAKVVRLEQNYRSTPHILGAASGLITANESRLGKTLWTETDQGEKVTLRGLWDGDEEARTIGEDVEQLQRDGHLLREMAILVRASFQMREFEDRFINLGLPYRVVGGPRFYERMEVRDANAYFRLVAQQDDDLAFERILNKPKRGLGDKALQTIHQLARAEGMSLMRAARLIIQTEELRQPARRNLRDFVEMVDRWRALLAGMSHIELAETILDESGYTEMWQNDRSADAPGRLDNLKEVVRSMEHFENLAGYLEHISLVMEIEQADTADKINLMTLHSAKGLEFDTVFLPGWEEGLFPHQRALDESGLAGLEEERRLAYVGITRAKKNARISFVANRRIHNMWQSSMPSRFIDELPQDHVEVLTGDTQFGGYGSYGQSRFDHEFSQSSYTAPGWQRAQANARSGAMKTKPPQIDGQAELVATSDPSASTYTAGERVFHQKFGYGIVHEIDGNKLTVNFEHSGQKKVIDTFVERHG